MFFKSENLRKFSDNSCVKFYKLNGEFDQYFYRDIINCVDSINQILDSDKFQFENQTIFGLAFPDHSPVLLPLIVSILSRSGIFFFTSDSDLQNETKFVEPEPAFVFTYDNICLAESEYEEKATINVLNVSIKLWKNCNGRPKEFAPDSICYCCRTSGSTGIPKLVWVPFTCILSNINRLVSIFDIKSSDVLFATSPTTFDPFIVDLFMTLTCGACLVLTENSLRLNHQRTGEFLFDKHGTGCVTFMQTTPSFFKLWSPDVIRSNILSESSSLRNLSFGGEPFPINNIASWIDLSSTRRKIKIFNIYGITEISCWSTIEEVVEELNEISIGNPIEPDTILKMDDSGELKIGSRSRICLIDDEAPSMLTSNEIVFRSTGDLVENIAGTFFYRGRIDHTIKRFGVKISLDKIERVADGTKCIFYDNKIIMFSTNKSEEDELRSRLLSQLSDHEIPDEIIRIEKLPLSCHGKISNQKLVEIYRKNKANREESIDSQFFIEEIVKLLGGRNESKKPRIDVASSSFKHLGGTSVNALKLLAIVEEKYHTNFPKLVGILLDENESLKSAIDYLHEFESTPTFTDHRIESAINSEIIKKFNLEKCIDSNPSIILVGNRKIISVGSHSGVLVNIDFETMEIISKLTFPDRIESQVAGDEDHRGYVGCYDGFLYCFNVDDGEILWRFDSGGMIKCRPLIVDKKVFFGNYNSRTNFWRLNRENGELDVSWIIGGGSIVSSPMELDPGRIVAGTLDGVLAMVDSAIGNVVWSKKFKSPIFGDCERIKDDCGGWWIFTAEVIGIVHCTSQCGDEVWTYQADGNIFSSFEILSNHMYFGCHDNRVYALNIKVQPNESRLAWKTEKLSSQIYATPRVIRIDDVPLIIACCSTSGDIMLLNTENGSIGGHSNSIGGPIFSTPSIDTNISIIGCRDNFLYVIKYDK